MFSFGELVVVLFVLAGAIAIGVAGGMLIAGLVRFWCEDWRQSRRLAELKSSLLAAQREERKHRAEVALGRQDAPRAAIRPAPAPSGGVQS